MESIFENIQLTITEELMKAQKSITVVVAWFTSKRLFDILKYKQGRGIRICVIVNDDDINKKLPLDHLNNSNGKVLHINLQNGGLMHYKFCLIDSSVLISGSYNWTTKAENNKEYINIMRGEEFDVELYENNIRNLIVLSTSTRAASITSRTKMRNMIKVPFNVSLMMTKHSLIGQRFLLQFSCELQQYLHFNKENKLEFSDIPNEIQILTRHLNNGMVHVSASAVTQLSMRMSEDSTEEGDYIFSSVKPILSKRGKDTQKNIIQGIALELSEKGKEHVCNLKRGYIQFNKDIIFKSDSSTPVNLYMLVKRYSGISHNKTFVIPYDTFTELMNLKGKYTNWEKITTLLNRATEKLDNMYKDGVCEFQIAYKPLYPGTRNRGYPTEIKIDLTY